MKQHRSRTETPAPNLSTEHTFAIDGTGERAGKWTVMAIVAIGVFMISRHH
jgi:hypothetical protein